MGMERINGNPLVQPGHFDQVRPQPKADEKQAAPGHAGSGSAETLPPARGDRAEISATAHQLMALRQAVDTGREALSALPEIREDKIALARERLHNGFYRSDEVRDGVAAGVERIISSMDEL